MFILDHQNVLFARTVADRDEAIRVLGARMVETGYIQEQYIDSVIERESQYPTGLPTEGAVVAIPHANAEAVMRSTIGVMTLKKPVQFQCMGDASESLDVEVVFLLANADQSDQPKSLQRLMTCFSEEHTLAAIKNAKEEAEIIAVLQAYMEE